MKYIVFVLWMMGSGFAGAEDDVENIVTIEENSVSMVEKDGAVQLSMTVLVKDGFFAYREKFELNLADFNVVGLTLDPIVSFYDKTFQKNKEGVRNQAHLTANLQLKTKSVPDVVDIQLVYQACTVEYCLFPAQASTRYQVSAGDRQLLAASSAPEWFKKGLFLSLVFVFLAGFLTSLTPCVYPMLPLTLAVLGASSTRSHLEGFSRSLVYVLGMALTYSVMGVLAATTGFMFGSLLSNIYFLVILALILFVAALSMFDVFEIQTPKFLQARLNVGGKSSSYVALFMTGLFSGLIAGPCVGPVLVGVLGYVSRTGSLVLGFVLLFTFALGLGSLVIVLGTFSGLVKKIPRSGKWMVVLKKLIGVLFLAMVIYFLAPALNIQTLVLVSLGMVAVFSVILLFKNRQEGAASRLEISLYRSALIFSILFIAATSILSRERFERLIGYSSQTFANTHWDVFTPESLAAAQANGDYVVLDFYADWCAACRELKHKTFSNPKVSDYSPKIKWLYFDSTVSTPELAQLKEKYRILGLPTILLFNNKGELQEDLTLTGFEEPELFIQRLDKLFKGSAK